MNIEYRFLEPGEQIQREDEFFGLYATWQNATWQKTTLGSMGMRVNEKNCKSYRRIVKNENQKTS